MSTEISPYNSLSDTMEMYQHLKTKIKQASDFNALFPFVAFITTLDQFKSQLTSLLEEKYITNNTTQNQDDNQNDNSCIRPLFISQFKLNGIPSDIMHANIISYLPSKDFTKLPLVCKHFHHIMTNYPFIYNDKGYKVAIGCEKSDHYDGSLEISIDHINKNIEICSTNKSTLNLPVLFLKDSKFPIYKIKHWNILDRDAKIDELLSKAENTIQKLSFGVKQSSRLYPFAQMAHDIFNNHKGWRFNQCKVISIQQTDNTKLPTFKDSAASFKNVEILEISVVSLPQSTDNYGYGTYYSTPNITSDFYADLNNILSYLSVSLKCLVFEDNRESVNYRGYGHGSMYGHSRTECEASIKIPENVEWLKIKHDIADGHYYRSRNSDDLPQIDLSKCKKLMGMKYAKSQRMESIIYPQEYVIPFAHFAGVYNNLEKTSCYNIRFICGIYPNQTLRGCQIYDVKSRLKQNIHDNQDRELLCLELNGTELNNENENLLQKLLKYVFDDENSRIEKIVKYSKWWSLGSALWIANCVEPVE